MNGPLDRPVTLITGTSRGIGQDLAEHYCRKGHWVVGVSRSAAKVEHPAYSHVIADICSEIDVKRIVRECRGRFGRIDNLINNAAVASMNHSLTTPTSTVQSLMDTNFLGAFLLCREVGKAMQIRRHGRIVNFSTIAVPLHLAGEAAYVASKAALTSFSQVLARELAPLGITVNVLGPGVTETRMTKSLSETTLAKVLAHQPLSRMCTGADIANDVDFFLADGSSQITGQSLYLGGVI